MSADALIDEAQRKRPVERHRSFTEHFDNFPEPSGYVEIPSWHLNWSDILRDLKEIANHPACRPWSAYDQLVLERARVFDMFRYRSPTATDEILGPVPEELPEWWELETDSDRLNAFRDKLRTEGVDTVYAKWELAVAAVLDPLEKADVADKRAREETAARHSRSIAKPQNKSECIQVTKMYLGNLLQHDIDSVLHQEPEHQTSRLPAHRKSVRLTCKERSWVKPTCVRTGEPSRGVRRREGLWNAPLCPAEPPLTQVDAIPSVGFLAEIGRRDEMPPLSRRARTEARTHVGLIVDRQRVAFESCCGFSAAAARRRAILKKIEWAKAWTNKPIPPKQLPGIITWTEAPEYRLVRLRPSTLSTSTPAKRVPTRTRNKRKFAPKNAGLR